MELPHNLDAHKCSQVFQQWKTVVDTSSTSTKDADVGSLSALLAGSFYELSAMEESQEGLLARIFGGSGGRLEELDTFHSNFLFLSEHVEQEHKHRMAEHGAAVRAASAMGSGEKTMQQLEADPPKPPSDWGKRLLKNVLYKSGADILAARKKVRMPASCRAAIPPMWLLHAIGVLTPKVEELRPRSILECLVNKILLALAGLPSGAEGGESSGSLQDLRGSDRRLTNLVRHWLIPQSLADVAFTAEAEKKAFSQEDTTLHNPKPPGASTPAPQQHDPAAWFAPHDGSRARPFPRTDFAPAAAERPHHPLTNDFDARRNEALWGVKHGLYEKFFGRIALAHPADPLAQTVRYSANMAAFYSADGLADLLTERAGLADALCSMRIKIIFYKRTTC